MRIITGPILTCLIVLCFGFSASARQYSVVSPSGKLSATIDCDSTLRWAVNETGREILSPSPLSMTLADGSIWGNNANVVKAMKGSANNTISTPFTSHREMVDSYRKGSDWYIGGINGWEPMEIEIDLFKLNLPANSKMTLFTDGINASRNGNDYVRKNSEVDTSKPLKVHLSNGGGFAAKISPVSSL